VGQETDTAPVVHLADELPGVCCQGGQFFFRAINEEMVNLRKSAHGVNFFPHQKQDAVGISLHPAHPYIVVGRHDEVQAGARGSLGYRLMVRGPIGIDSMDVEVADDFVFIHTGAMIPDGGSIVKR
jgi:hypothetical protein